ncbi:hypothetical protein GE09DRAFT_476559 [Coniochaeta sp. 2T2.1]|nr:hypothetical protein GE09DRAFT_476559 [Coniochaeta sp. 2T2.1]
MGFSHLRFSHCSYRLGHRLLLKTSGPGPVRTRNCACILSAFAPIPRPPRRLLSAELLVDLSISVSQSCSTSSPVKGGWGTCAYSVLPSSPNGRPRVTVPPITPTVSRDALLPVVKWFLEWGAGLGFVFYRKSRQAMVKAAAGAIIVYAGCLLVSWVAKMI